ncbi:MAG: PQQ-binding-like beta-propeller repeat protein [Planctomycetaceae bacterium]
MSVTRGLREHRMSLLFGVVVAWVLMASLEPLAAQPEAKGEWPQILGPQRNGLSSETGLLDRWPDEGPKEVWRVPGGVGMSGLAISRGRVLTLVQRESQQWLIALDAKSGEAIWQTPLAPEYRNAMGNGPRATPTIAGEHVFVFTGEGILSAHKFLDGKQLWSHHVVKELSGKEAEYGMACSPLVVGEQVIVTAGSPQGTLVAFETKSGKQLWTAGNDPAGYSSPALLNVGGRSQIVAFTANSALGVDPAKGTVLWRYPFKTNYECNVVTPLEIKGDVFLSSGEDHGSVRLALKPKAESFEITEVWSSFGTKSVLRNEWQTSMLLDGYLYGFDNVGGAGPITHLTCIDAATGQRKWQQARFGKGNFIAADGKLFISTMKGELVLVRATPDRFEELSRATVLGSTRQAPALSNGRLFLRDDKEIVCFDVRKP